MGRLNKAEQSYTLPIAAIVVWMAAVAAMALAWAPPAKGFADPGSARLVIVHVPFAIMAVVAYVVSTVYAISYLSKRQPSADVKSSVSAGLGFWLTVLATVSGMVFAKLQWGSAWNWDPRETSIMMLLIVYAGYFALRGAIADRGARGRIGAVYNIMACVVMPYLVFVLPRITGGLHPTRAHLSMEYRAAMLVCAAGLVWIYVWLFRLRVRGREK
jgi:heme exporter protein C